MKILHLSHSDISGGAARAAYRLHRALLEVGIESQMKVRIKKSDDWTVRGAQGGLGKLVNMLRGGVGSQLTKLQRTMNVNFHSCDWIPSNWAKQINDSDVDIVHLHWVAGETMSVEDIGRIKKPIVWTMHDMWPFCGSEHVTEFDETARWRLGYTRLNRGEFERGFDLDRHTWLRKIKSWRQPMHIVSPSNWLAECARGSILLQDKKISIIPNTLNTEVYKPLDHLFCRKVLNLPEDKKIILFGAMGGGKDNNKGYDLLVSALDILSARYKFDDVLCVVFGQSEPQHVSVLPFKVHWLGHIHDDETLALLYNAATMMVVPSRKENLPQTATEAQACGTPVVAFNCTGLTDVIEHKQTGYLAQAYDTQDMATGMQWILENKTECERLGVNSRIRAQELWAMDVVVKQYQLIYCDVLNVSCI